MRIIALPRLLPAACLLALAACASTSHVLVGQARAPISPDQVKVYLSPPAKYEQIATLDASSSGSFTFGAQAMTDVVMQRLKAEAAKLGANGILFQGMGDRPSGSVGTGLGSSSYGRSSALGVGLGTSVALNNKVGHGMAIYVTQE
ncbi:MAG: hypothetical protein JSR67_16390 [Proteobacteria bacterium]|nr:hypothetical protein [Pseudomonadota bacterium]